MSITHFADPLGPGGGPMPNPKFVEFPRFLYNF